MFLRFLGRTYFKFQKRIETIASEDTACYRGQRYNLRAPVAIEKPKTSGSQMSIIIYKYRGVNYVVERHQFPKQKKLVSH